MDVLSVTPFTGVWVEIIIIIIIIRRPHDNQSTTPINPIFFPYVGKHLPCPHLHLHQHGFGDKWAISMPEDQFINQTNLVQTFKDFC